MFNVGDKVLIIDSQDIQAMREKIGTIATVTRVGKNGDYYNLDCDSYSWLEKWLDSNTAEVSENEFADILGG